MGWRGMAYPEVLRVDCDWLRLGRWLDYFTAGGKGDVHTSRLKIKAGSVMISASLISIVSAVGYDG